MGCNRWLAGQSTSANSHALINEGLHHLLQHVGCVHLTGLPKAYKLQGNVPFQTTRCDLRDGKKPTPLQSSLSEELTIALDVTHTKPLSCYIVAGFDSSGHLCDLRHGAGSVVVYK